MIELFRLVRTVRRNPGFQSELDPFKKGGRNFFWGDFRVLFSGSVGFGLNTPPGEFAGKCFGRLWKTLGDFFWLGN